MFSYFSACVSISFDPHTTNIGGSKGACAGHASPRVQILSFRHKNFSKRNRLGSQRPSPLREILDPPLTNYIATSSFQKISFTMFFLYGNYFSLQILENLLKSEVTVCTLN